MITELVTLYFLIGWTPVHGIPLRPPQSGLISSSENQSHQSQPLKKMFHQTDFGRPVPANLSEFEGNEVDVHAWDSVPSSQLRLRKEEDDLGHGGQGSKSPERSGAGIIDFLLRNRKRVKRQTREDPKDSVDDICGLTPPKPGQKRPLRCYQCKSSTKDPDPQCDTRLFKYLRHSEKFTLRKRCLVDNGDYCLKTVMRRHGERITERGCFAGPIIGPEGTALRTKEGCYTYPKDGYLTTTCFCNSENCNSATQKYPGILYLILITILLTVKNSTFCLRCFNPDWMM